MHESLTESVLSYQRSRHGLGPLLDRISLFVYTYPRTRLGWTEDDCGEFFCFFFPRLQGLVERFEFHGRPFEVYLIVTLKWQLRTYAGRLATANLHARILTRENFWACEESDLYSDAATPGAPRRECSTELAIPENVRGILKMDDRNMIVDPPSKRRVLYLALKSAIRMTETLIQRTSLITGYDPDWIHGLIEELKARVQCRRIRLDLLSQKRNGCFFRIYCLQEQLHLVAEDSVRSELSRQLMQEEQRLSNMLDEIAHVRLCPTHRDIADVLGIPKGTVDSGLYYLKESFGALCN